MNVTINSLQRNQAVGDKRQMTYRQNFEEDLVIEETAYLFPLSTECWCSNYLGQYYVSDLKLPELFPQNNIYIGFCLKNGVVCQ